MNFGKSWLVFQKDWVEIRQSKQILLPIIVLPTVMVVILPLVAIQVPLMLASNVNLGQQSIDFGLPQFASFTVGMTEKQAFVYVMSTVFFAPFTLLVPLVVSSIISSDSFAGEKERRTIEALFATPISDLELLVGKILAAFIPTMGATLISFAVYTAITDAVNWPLFGYPILPNLMWILILIGLAPGFAIAATGLTVIVSTRVSGTREAQQITGLLVIPILILMLGQTTGVLVLGYVPLILLLVGIGIIDVVIIRVGVRTFNRERMLSKL